MSGQAIFVPGCIGDGLLDACAGRFLNQARRPSRSGVELPRIWDTR